MTTVEEQVAVLERQIRVNEDAQNALREQVRRLGAEIDAKRLAAKPDFPTRAMRDDIAEALRMLSDGYKSKSHHGDPVRESDWASPVRVGTLGTLGWLMVNHQAPYAKRRMGSRLWHFTDAEVETILALVTESGWRVADHWLHGDGISIRVIQS